MAVYKNFNQLSSDMTWMWDSMAAATCFVYPGLGFMLAACPGYSLSLSLSQLGLAPASWRALIDGWMNTFDVLDLFVHGLWMHCMHVSLQAGLEISR